MKHQKKMQTRTLHSDRSIATRSLRSDRTVSDIVKRPQQEADDYQGSDVEEITLVEFRLSMGYFIRVEEAEEDIDPMFRRVVQKLKDNAHPKREQGESSRGKSRRRD
ncbi:hypothetical protein IGI04_036450 [Brassica rapa subsp. trilocularis]|uniref:Uncharacterized protein n=1 Tax=Brassica rapa subsp. trilocularis TaxID=1813537 RepID=A0ABQ7LGB1_BRACM|nr:hypothetical protein IGI04_036450 [Brassica rapa subsp. trilocularis]